MKPRQIFTLNFQNDIEGQLKDVTTKQLLKLCIHIMTLLPFNFLIMFEFEEEFSCLFQHFSKALAEVLKFKAHKPIKRFVHSAMNRPQYLENLTIFSLLHSNNDWTRTT